jgi:hypothetical protein
MSSNNVESDEDAFATPNDLDELFDSDLDGLLDLPDKPQKISSSDRLEQAFLDVLDFRRLKGRTPSSSTRDIAERRLGARLDGILADDEKVAALKALDEFSLLELPDAPDSIEDLLNGDDLGLLDDESGLLDVSALPVRKAPDSPDSVARRKKCPDFQRFERLFKAKHLELAEGTAKLAPFKGLPTVQEGRFFVLNGLMLFVAEVGETKTLVVGGKPEPKQRLRAIFENGTESALYRQSLSIRLHEHEGQAVVRTGIEDEEIFDADTESGHIYVLRSLSKDPQIAGIVDLHKIGFSRTRVEDRIKNAEKSPTYLMAPVKVVEDYRTYNLRPSALENLLHRVFAEVRLDLTQIDHKGRNYDPSEWFVVSRKVINQAITMIMSGEIVDYVYDARLGRLVEREGQ